MSCFDFGRVVSSPENGIDMKNLFYSFFRMDGDDGDQQILPVGIYTAVTSLSWHTNGIINPAVFLERCLDGAAFQEDPTSWTECFGQQSLASFPPWFNKEIANLHMLLLPLLQNEILSRWLKTAVERNDVFEESWLLIKTICRTMDNLRSRSRLWSAENYQNPWLLHTCLQLYTKGQKFLRNI
ncbi:uncharacterized protein LOC126051929 isoform X2 [Accipiter gentilis]|uniref:uncharacterized protein LOC126051929 isoform X2 n=1 Tax=Astur gentilis TaxID=8957 RepID=UPI00210F4F62|nr:uncharacterized protein LOC126051929 isoform X2 [Accipiter gentilis]